MSRATLSIARQELKGFLDRPAGWVLLAVFVGLMDFLFFRSLAATGEASMRGWFGILPWVFLIFVPAITMRLIAEEERSGTIELLLSQPVRLIDVLAGKFLGGWSIVCLALVASLPVPILLATAGRLDWGVVATQYLAAALLGGAITTIGLFASSLTKNQVLASILAAVITFACMVLGFELVTITVPRRVAEVFTSLSLLSHFESMSRGVIDLRDAAYFVAIAAAFFAGAYAVLAARRANRRSESFYNLQLGVVLILGICVAANMLVAPFGLRLDLTANRLFTLSGATKNILRGLDDQVTLTLFASRDLPPQVATTYRDVRDVLRDYAQASRGKVQLVERFPDIDPQAAQTAQSLGVEAVQFNVVKREQFSVQQGWLGVALQSGSDREAISFVQQAGDLEYQLASLIVKMTDTGKRTVGFTGGHNERPASEYGILRRELGKTYTVKDVSSDPDKGLDLSGLRALIVAGPQAPFSATERAAVRRYIDGGGAALFMLEGYTINTQFLIATPSGDNLGPLTGGYGARVQKKLLYDLKSNEAVSFSAGQRAYTVPYPFWPRPRVASQDVAGDLDTIVLTWASPVTAPTTETPKGAEVIPLLTTSPEAGSEAGQPTISPDRDFTADARDLKTLTAGAAVIGPEGKKRWRIAVIGDSEFPTDRFAENAPENIILALNTVDWLAQDEALTAIRSKRGEPRQLQFGSFVHQAITVWGNQFGVPLVLAIIGTWHLTRRRARARRGDAR